VVRDARLPAAIDRPGAHGIGSAATAVRITRAACLAARRRVARACPTSAVRIARARRVAGRRVVAGAATDLLAAHLRRVALEADVAAAATRARASERADRTLLGIVAGASRNQDQADREERPTRHASPISWFLDSGDKKRS
jgi:hypothetical protein